MQGEDDNQASNDQKDEHDYVEADVMVEDCEEGGNEFGALEDEFAGFTKESDFVQNDDDNQYVDNAGSGHGSFVDSRPGSFVDPSIGNEIDADQEYRSNGEELDDYVDDV